MMSTMPGTPTLASVPAALFRGSHRVVGHVELHQDVLRFRASREAQEPFELPLEGARCTITGFDNSSLLIEHPALPDWQLVVDDPRLLDRPPLSTHPAFAAARGQRAGRIRRFRLVIGCLLALAAFAGLVALLGAWWVVSLVRDRITELEPVPSPHVVVSAARVAEAD